MNTTPTDAGYVAVLPAEKEQVDSNLLSVALQRELLVEICRRAQV
jgi:hypothetical protein